MTTRRKIVLFVWGAHLLVVCMLLINHFWTYQKKTSQPMVVRTIAPMVQEKPVEKKAVTKPKPAASQKPRPPTPKAKPIPSAALQHVKEALAALDTLQPAPALSVPAQVHFVKDNKTSEAQQTYGAYVASFLEKELILPEYGEVKMELQIDKRGQVVQLVLLTVENTQNAEFLKNRLPELTFPCFNEFDIDANRLTFTISFRNAHL